MSSTCVYVYVYSQIVEANSESYYLFCIHVILIAIVKSVAIVCSRLVNLFAFA